MSAEKQLLREVTHDEGGIQDVILIEAAWDDFKKENVAFIFHIHDGYRERDVFMNATLARKVAAVLTAFADSEGLK